MYQPSKPHHPTLRGDRCTAARRSATSAPALAGAGAVTFALTVLAQNIIRGASAPANGASAADVTDPLRRPSGDHVRTDRLVRARRRRAVRVPRWSDASTCRQRSEGMGVHRHVRSSEHPRSVHRRRRRRAGVVVGRHTRPTQRRRCDRGAVGSAQQRVRLARPVDRHGTARACRGQASLPESLRRSTGDSPRSVRQCSSSERSPARRSRSATRCRCSVLPASASSSG